MFNCSYLRMSTKCLEECSMALKEFNVALDVVNFRSQGHKNPTQKKEYLKAFVVSANDNGNSCYHYAPTVSRDSLSEQLKRFIIYCTILISLHFLFFFWLIFVYILLSDLQSCLVLKVL